MDKIWSHQYTSGDFFKYQELLMLDRFRSMEVFAAAVEAGSYAAASSQLGMTSQMVARHVQALGLR